MNELIEKEQKYIYKTYNRLPIVVKKTEGCYIYDDQENKYLDFMTGIAVNSLGNKYPDVISAITNQLNNYLHLSNYFYQEPQIKLAELLIEKTGLSKVFFSNSGTESVEATIKLIRKWASQNNKKKILSINDGFHGRTLGALSLMSQELYKENMGPYFDDCIILSEAEICKMDLHDTAAIIFETIQGEGGIKAVSENFIAKINEAQKKYGMLVVCDEIQSGIGRTGSLFAYNHYNLKPDVVLTAKALGGGLPLGAIIVSKRLESVWQPGNHGSTFGGNAVACAAGIAVLKIIDEELLNNVVRLSEYFKKNLLLTQKRHSSIIKDVRVFGFLIGIELNIDPKKLVNQLMIKQVLTCSASNNVLRILPPLIINEGHIDCFINKLNEALDELS